MVQFTLEEELGELLPNPLAVVWQGLCSWDLTSPSVILEMRTGSCPEAWQAIMTFHLGSCLQTPHQPFLISFVGECV